MKERISLSEKDWKAYSKRQVYIISCAGCGKYMGVVWTRTDIAYHSNSVFCSMTCQYNKISELNQMRTAKKTLSIGGKQN